MLRKPTIIMRISVSNHDFLDPMIIKVLEQSNVSMSILAISYMVNQTAGRTVNLRIVKDHLAFLVRDKKISESFDRGRSITSYKLL